MRISQIQDYQINRLTDVIHEFQDEILRLQDATKEYRIDCTDEIKALVEKLNNANTQKYNLIDARAIEQEQQQQHELVKAVVKRNNKFKGRNAGDEKLLETYRQLSAKAEKSKKVVEYFELLANAK